MTAEARGWSDVRKGPSAKECGQHLETVKGKEIDSLQNLQKECSQANILIWDFWPPEQWEDEFLFKPPSWWSFFTTALQNEYTCPRGIWLIVAKPREGLAVRPHFGMAWWRQEGAASTFFSALCPSQHGISILSDGFFWGHGFRCPRIAREKASDWPGSGCVTLPSPLEPPGWNKRHSNSPKEGSCCRL